MAGVEDGGDGGEPPAGATAMTARRGPRLRRQRPDLPFERPALAEGRRHAGQGLAQVATGIAGQPDRSGHQARAR